MVCQRSRRKELARRSFVVRLLLHPSLLLLPPFGSLSLHPPFPLAPSDHLAVLLDVNSCLQGVRHGSRRVHLEWRAVPGVEDDGRIQLEGELYSTLYPPDAPLRSSPHALDRLVGSTTAADCG